MGKTIAQLGFGSSDFLTGSTLINSGTVERNINGDGKLSLSWKSTGNGAILPAGTEIDAGAFGTFILQDHYVPSDNGDGTYTYSPSFICEDYMLTGLLFYMQFDVTDVASGRAENITLYTFPFTGPLSQICNQLATVSGYAVNYPAESADLIVSVNFDGDNCKSAAQKIASAAGFTAVFTGGTIGIGTSEAYSPDAYYDRFIVMGGTRNMGKKTISGQYATVTQRLMLDNAGSIIGPAEPRGHRTKLLINDSIYPKMELVITSVSSRICWMYDEGGNKIIDYYTYLNGEKAVFHHAEVTETGVTVYYDSNNIPIYPVHKQYCKWYITLGIERTDLPPKPYALDTNTVLLGCPLGMLFQSGVLAGREFDLAYFETATSEHEEDDVAQNFDVAAGSYRIIMQADGSVLLPGMPNSGMCPAVGDKVTLVNVAMDDIYYNTARAELRKWGESMAAFYSQVKPESFQLHSTWLDFLTGGNSAYSIGMPVDTDGQPVSGGSGDYIVTAVQTDLISGKQTVTYGTFKSKGLMQSIVDQIEGASLSGGGAFVGSDDYRHTAPIGIDSFNALHHAGGNVQVIGLNQKLSNATNKIDEVYEPFIDVMEQVDRKFDVWYGNGTPSPYISEYGGVVNDHSDAEPNYPASEWTTAEEKAKHVQDIYYDMLREPGLTGGTAWRWTLKNDKYVWEDITDSQTLASLEKISDVATDGKITGGVEKMRVFIDWMKAFNEYMSFKDRNSEEYSAAVFAAYEDAFLNLAYILNGGTWDQLAEVDEDGNVVSFIIDAVPYMVRDLNVTTVIGVTEEQILPYYNAWRAYYTALAALNADLAKVANERAKASLQSLANIASDLWITNIEKTQAGGLIDMWKEIVEERLYIEQRAVKARLELSSETWNDYVGAYYALGSFLNDFGETTWYGEDPVMLFNGEDTQLTAEQRQTFNTVWSNYYATREVVMTAVSVSRQTYFVGQDVPTPPYYRGDLWMKVSNSDNEKGTLMMCIYDNETSVGKLSDWKEYSVNTNDPRMLLASIIEGCYTLGMLTGEEQHFTRDDVTGANEDLVTLVKDTFTRFSTLTGVMSIAVFGTRPSQPSEWDVVIKPFRITIHGQQYVGRVYVEMYNGSGWEIIISSVGSIIENLGDMIRMVVYGTNDPGEDGDVISVTGEEIKRNFISLFAESKMKNPLYPEHSDKPEVSLAEALFGIKIERVLNPDGTPAFDEDGYPLYQSLMMLSADKIEFKGKMVVKNDDGEDTMTIDQQGNLYSMGDFLSAKDGVYSRMSAGQFEFGSYVDTEEGRTYKPRYVFNVDGNGTPILNVVDSDGNTIGQITDELFTNITKVLDTWTAGYFKPVAGGQDINWDIVNETAAVALYQLKQGCKITQNSDGSKTYEYTWADGTKHDAPDPALNGRWFTQKEINTAYYASGLYADAPVKGHSERNAENTEVAVWLTRDVWTFNSGIKYYYTTIESSREIHTIKS